MKVSRMDGKMQEMDVRKVWAEVFGQAVENRPGSLLQRDGTLVCMLDSGPLKEEFQHASRTLPIESMNTWKPWFSRSASSDVHRMGATCSE